MSKMLILKAKCKSIIWSDTEKKAAIDDKDVELCVIPGKQLNIRLSGQEIIIDAELAFHLLDMIVYPTFSDHPEIESDKKEFTKSKNKS